MGFSDTPVPMPDMVPSKIFLLIDRKSGRIVPALDSSTAIFPLFVAATSRESAEQSKRDHLHKYKMVVDILELAVTHAN